MKLPANESQRGGFRERSKTDERLPDIARRREDDKGTNSKRKRKDKEKERESRSSFPSPYLEVICARFRWWEEEKVGVFEGLGSVQSFR